jgi:AraC-like DNA-binding protein
MLYRSHTPAPPLADLIERFWSCSDAPSHDRERIVPSGTVELVFNLRDDEIRIYDPLRPDQFKRFSGAVVSGTYSRYFVIDPHQHASIMGVHFRPGGAVPFLGAPSIDLADTHVDLSTFWGPAAGELREQLCAVADNSAKRFAILETALLQRLRRAPRRHSAVSFALNAFAQTSVSGGVRDVARSVGLSDRRFIQLFAAEVGLTPKLFCRVQRFQRARERASQVTSPNWAAIAVACGYFDQSHLIRDFSEFSGFSPMAYLSRRGQPVLTNHVPHAG